jgi:copper chaperone CopZ
MRVEKALSSIEGVKKARVDLDDGSAVVESSVELDREFLREVIDEAGYVLKEIED